MAGVKGMRHRRRKDDRALIRIDTQKIVNRLERHVDGEIDMPASAVTAALGLLKKKMPDLAATTISGDENNPLKLTVQAIQQTIVRAKPGELTDSKLIEHDASHALPGTAQRSEDDNNIK